MGYKTSLLWTDCTGRYSVFRGVVGLIELKLLPLHAVIKVICIDEVIHLGIFILPFILFLLLVWLLTGIIYHFVAPIELDFIHVYLTFFTCL